MQRHQLNLIKFVVIKYKYIVHYNTHEQLRLLGVCVVALNTDVLTTAGSFPLKYHPWQPLIGEPNRNICPSAEANQIPR